MSDLIEKLEAWAFDGKDCTHDGFTYKVDLSSHDMLNLLKSVIEAVEKSKAIREKPGTCATQEEFMRGVQRIFEMQDIALADLREKLETK